MRREAEQLGIELPPLGAYASGMVFLSQEAETAAWQQQSFERVVTEMGQRLLGWRDVPVQRHRIGRISGAAMPVIFGRSFSIFWMSAAGTWPST